ncbi:MAG: TonB-dependent receptor [Gemmatimonadales bacterium]
MLSLLLLLQAATGRIDGTVSTDAGEPIVGGTVAIAALGRRVETDGAGRFTFSGLRAGTWRLTVSAERFESTALSVEVSADRAVRIDIGLTPLDPDRARPALEIEVRAADDGSPIDLATVELAGQTRTSAGGRVVFRDLAAGPHRLRARRLGFVAIDTVVLARDGTGRVALRLVPSPRDLPTLDVVASTSRGATPISAPGDLAGGLLTGFARLSHRELETVPPTFEPDVLRALQATTGIGGANDINAHLAIRGGAPEHTLFLLDGAPVLGPYHMFGLFGAFNPDAVDDAQVLRGSLPARVGGALGAVVSLRSARPDSLRITGGATVLTSRLAASGPLGGAGSWLLAGRRTNLGFGKSGPFDLDVPYWFWDVQGTLRLAPGRDQEITVTAYGSGDKFSEDLFFVDQGSAPLFSTWTNRIASASWRLARPSGWGASLGLWLSEYRSSLAIGDTTLRADSASTNGTTRLSGVTVAVGRPLPRGSIRFGAGLTVNRAALLGDSVAPGYLDDRVDRRVVELSASAELEQWIGPIALAPSLRLTRWDRGGGWSLEPRLAARWESKSGWSVTASVNRTEQALFALRDDRLPILGVPFWSLPDSLEPRAGATSVELAVQGAVAAGWTVEASIFHRRLSGLPRWRPTGKRDLSQLDFDDGTASGLELSLARRAGTLTGWVSYTPLIAKVQEGAGASYRPLWDRRHALDAVAQLRVGRWLYLSHRLTVATGQPFWVEQGMFAGAEFDPVTGTARQRSDAPFPIWSSTQGRLPLYFRADLTARATWRVGGVRIVPFAGLVNLTNRRNVTGYRAQPGGLQGTIEYLPRRQLPRVPVLGVDFTIGQERR